MFRRREDEKSRVSTLFGDAQKKSTAFRRKRKNKDALRVFPTARLYFGAYPLVKNDIRRHRTPLDKKPLFKIQTEVFRCFSPCIAAFDTHCARMRRVSSLRPKITAAFVAARPVSPRLTRIAPESAAFVASPDELNCRFRSICAKRLCIYRRVPIPFYPYRRWHLPSCGRARPRP